VVTSPTALSDTAGLALGGRAAWGVFLGLGGAAWGHSLTRLLQDVHQQLTVPQELVQAAQRLDKHDILTRSPNGCDTGAPFHYYTHAEGLQARADA
jgi:HEPN domain-containing protein